jgi:beta-galactosidase
LLLPPGEQPATYAYDVGDPLILGMAHDLMRGLKQRPFWVMEQQTGHINWSSTNVGIRRGTPRLWCWHALAAGAETIVFFRWRASLFAHEQYHSGLLRHDSSPDVGWRDLRQMQTERDRIDRIAAAPLQALVALLFDYDDLWALQLQPHRRDFHYLRHLFVYYRALKQIGITVDLVSSDADLSAYRLVIAPTAHTATAERAAKLRKYAEQGGTLLLGVRSGFKTASNLVTDQPLPGTLRQLAGVKVVDWQVLPDGISWELATAVPNLTGLATYWVENLEPDTAQVLARYDSGMAALTENVVGNGRVLYLGFYPTPAQASALLTYLAHQTGLKTLTSLPPGLLVSRRGQDMILLNFTDEPLTTVIENEIVVVNGRDVQVYPLR